MFKRKKKSNINSQTGVDYEKLGRAIEGSLVKNYIYFLSSTKRQIWGSFVRGIFSGLGGVIGATVVVALIAYLLHVAGGLPVIGEYFRNIGQAIHK